MKHLLVHIGTGKTGSTAIQQALSQSEAQLRLQGVHYWGLNLEGADNSNRFPWQDQSGTGELQKLNDNVASRQLEEALMDALDRLPNGATAVWSNESIYERPGAYLSLLQGLQSEQVKCTIIAYARSHRDYIGSAYKQWGIKHKTYRGPILGFSDWVVARRNFLSYGVKLAQWDATFTDRFRIFNYDTIDDVVKHFNTFLPAGSDLTPGSHQRVNRSPGPGILALYALHNSQFKEPVTPEAMVNLLKQFPRVRQSQPVPAIQSLFPSTAQLDEAERVLKEDAELVNSLLRRHGQPAIGQGKADAGVPTRNHDEITSDVLAALMHIIIGQNQRIIQLEQALLGKEMG